MSADTLGTDMEGGARYTETASLVPSPAGRRISPDGPGEGLPLAVRPVRVEPDDVGLTLWA